VDVADQLIEDGEAEHPYLGVSLTDLTPQISARYGITGAESGALVSDLEPGGPAADAGLRAGDVVTAIGSEEVRGSGDLLSALRDYAPGDTVTLTVSGGGERQAEIELGRRGGGSS
jgi:S1-C subfamily serine protease